MLRDIIQNIKDGKMDLVLQDVEKVFTKLKVVKIGENSYHESSFSSSYYPCLGKDDTLFVLMDIYGKLAPSHDRCPNVSLKSFVTTSCWTVYRKLNKPAPEWLEKKFPKTSSYKKYELHRDWTTLANEIPPCLKEKFNSLLSRTFE